MARKWFKWIGVSLAVILFLITALILFLHTSWGKSIVRNKVENYLADKLQTTLSFGAIDYRLPNWIRLKDVLILDRRDDTLLSGGNIFVRINMLKLLSQDVDIGGIELENIVARICREAGDSTFNFQFFIDAFDAGEPDVTDTASKADPIRLSVHHVLLNNVRFTFNDKKEQQYFSATVGNLYCSPRELNPEKNLFSVNDFITKGCRITIIDSSITKDKPPGTRNENEFDEHVPQELPSLIIALKKLGLKDVSFSYKKPSVKLELSLALDTMQVDEASFDLAQQTAAAQNIFLSNSAITNSIWMDATASTTQQQPASQPDAGDTWNIAVDKISLIDNAVAYHNAALPPQKGFDYNHIDAKHINFFASQNKTGESGFNADIDSCSLLLNDKFHLKGLRTSVSYANSLLLIKDLAIAINQSQLNTKGQLAWELKPGKSVGFNEAFQCRIENSAISYADILDFQPQLAKTLPIALPSSGKLALSGNLVSTPQNLSVKDLKLYTSNNHFAFAGNADIHNGTGKDGINYKVAIKELRVQKQLLSTEMLRELEKENIRLPKALTLTGKLNGTMNKTVADLKLNSEYGQLNIKGEAKDLADMDKLKYDFVIDAKNFETGKWINQDSLLGALNGKILIKGRGYQPNKMAALCNLQLSSFVINAYTYSNMNLSGELSGKVFTAQGQINDPNLDVALDVHGKLGSKYPVLKGVIDINKADLKSLQLYSDTMVISSRISIDADEVGAGGIVASVFADSSIIYFKGKEVLLDSISLTGSSAQDSAHVKLTTPFLTAGLNTNYDLSQLPGEFEHLWHRIYPAKIPENIVGGNHWMSVNASLTQHELLTTFLPDLKLLHPLTITGESDVSKKDSFLFFRAATPEFSYDKLRAEQFLISAESIDSTTTFSVTANSIYSRNDTLMKPSISGWFQNDLLSFSARVDDHVGKEYYATSASVQFAKEKTVFRFVDDLTVNHNRWKVPVDNRVDIIKDGFIVNNLSLVNRGQSLSIASADTAALSPINIRIDSFDIGHMLALGSFNDTAIAAGILQADISIQQPVEKFPVFTGKAEIKGMAFHNIPVGDLVISSATAEDSLKLNGTITGNNQVDFNGSMHPRNGNISSTLSLQKLDMSLIQEFVKDFISRTSGNVTGDFHLAGTTKDPQLSGTIYFDSTAFAMKDFQALYKIDKQKITIDYPTIKFDHFTLTDTLNNKLSVDGTIKINNPSEYGLNLAVETKNFVALNARRRPDSYIYGSAIIDAKMNIGGTSNEPIIEGNGYLHDKSSIHYIFTKNNDYTKAGKEGIRFVDIDTLTSAEFEMLQTSADSLVTKGPNSGLMYNLNLEISKDAEFSIIIDPSTNDELVLKGEGQLNTGIEEDGSMGITGIYRLRSGYYKMNNQFLKSTFTLAPGSTITFNGDPYNAEADVTTQYEVMTSSTGLLNADESEMPGVTKRLPYLVILNIKGPISRPQLSFNIKLKKDAMSIDGSLKSAIEDELEKLRNDTSQINRQAFSLLVANRFTVTGQGDATASSFNPSTALSNGMSQFLTEAMNEVADDLIKGVDLEVDLKNYKRADNAETKTDVGVSVSKNYMNDRLVVTIGKNFTLGEDASTYQSNMQQYIPDITTAYKLSKDGRYQVKAYQKNEYDTVVEGYFTETGVAFTIELDYNKFKELVQRQKKSDNP